jgi:hypothetical protein
MKMKRMTISILMIMMCSFIPADGLTGRWQTKPSPKGNVTSVLFKADGSYETYINKKPFTTGSYALQDSVLSFVENGCNGYRGIYKIVFFSNGDSIRFQPITDSCVERREGMTRTILGRVK